MGPRAGSHRQTAGTAAYSLSYREAGHVTRLGWLARVPLSSGEVEVHHGDLVETREQWFVEGCWDGSLEQGGFDQSNSFFGSGIRLRSDEVIAVASRATVDNLFYCSTRDEVIISNSLLMLLAMTGARLAGDNGYEESFTGAVRGIKGYRKSFPVTHASFASVSQLYYGNLRIGQGELTVELPPCPASFESYDSYLAFLIGKATAICANATSSARRRPMDCYATLSTGYDSTAVACLVSKHCGVNRCVTTHPDGVGAAQREDARPIAAMLGMEPFFIDAASEGLGSRELYYYAANFHHFEMIFDKATRMFESKNHPTLLFTGYHGDKVWDRNLKERYLSDELKRGDMSGKGLGEIRLKAGFVNAALPFLGARTVSQIVAISKSAEMRPWSVGGDYDRPIPRRICEEAGIPRVAFGQQKRKITTHKSRPVDRDLRRRFMKDLKADFGIGSGRLLLFDVLDLLSYRLDRFRLFDFLSEWKRSALLGKANLRLLLSIWAINKTADSMHQKLSG